MKQMKKVLVLVAVLALLATGCVATQYSIYQGPLGGTELRVKEVPLDKVQKLGLQAPGQLGEKKLVCSYYQLPQDKTGFAPSTTVLLEACPGKESRVLAVAPDEGGAKVLFRGVVDLGSAFLGGPALRRPDTTSIAIGAPSATGTGGAGGSASAIGQGGQGGQGGGNTCVGPSCQ